MRNPFRKMSPEEEFVEGFLKGAKNQKFASMEAEELFKSIKSNFEEGDYVTAQQKVNELMRLATAPLREAAEQRTQDLINNLKKAQSGNE